MSKMTKWGTSSWMKEGVEMRNKSMAQPVKQIFVMPDGQILESTAVGEGAREFAKYAMAEKKRQLKELSK